MAPRNQQIRTDMPVKKGDKLEFEDMSKTAIANIKNLDIDCLVCIGGDGTLGIAYNFSGMASLLLECPRQ